MPRVKDWIENFFPTGYFYEFKHIFHLAWPTVSKIEQIKLLLSQQEIPNGYKAISFFNRF